MTSLPENPVKNLFTALEQLERKLENIPACRAAALQAGTALHDLEQADAVLDRVITEIRALLDADSGTDGREAEKPSGKEEC